ncbi:MAG: hypothetical protein EBU31_03255 [Proteobacteria bacterium]|nr:hypothetical protein [Pseudomonadota bacterium]
MRVLDFLAEHGFDASRIELLPEADRPRAMALIRQMQVLDHYPMESAEDSLVDATMARIDRWEAARAESMQIQRGGFSRFRLSDFVSIAALVLVGIGVLLPVAARVREQSLSTVCSNNMRTLYGAFDAYADANGGALPATASIGNFSSLFSPSPAMQPATQSMAEGWGRRQAMGVPTGQTIMVIRAPHTTIIMTSSTQDWSNINHGAHLTQLVSKGYLEAGALQCPSCAAGLPCIAYRVPARGERFMLRTPGRTVVVADANPLVEARRRGIVLPSTAVNSLNHGEQGQNMVFSDGAVEWRTSPFMTTPAGSMDNIWLPRDSSGREQLDMRSWPSASTDNFVTQ